MKDKQIEIERLRLLLVGCGDISKDLSKEATKAIDRGYRKASEVAREIFEEIEKIVAKEIRRCDSMREKCIDDPIYWEGGRHSLQQARYWLAELKKKYIGEDKNVTTNTEDGK
jgi:N-acetylglucosamine kinase-like BadF-type ATPase